ncbi:MAG: peptidyl-prolyl cis-trans isomerase [Sedimentisphaerales bacterium]|nr:peptidyl-prolyl cis-trans isomerase [Sedimentisphaerales bacterium]
MKETKTMENQSPESTPSVNPRVKLATSMGEIVIELNPQKAPITTENFLRYVNEKFYDGTIFHRVIPNFMIQCGGFSPGMNKKSTHAPIKNEASNGLKNDRGTLAMARTPDPDSASSQFFINHKDNISLNYAGPGNPGYAVFGHVIEGMDTVDKIAQVPTGNVGPYGDVPKTDVVIISAEVVPE